MCLYALFMLALQKWAAKKAGRELNHARPLCPRIGWRDEERASHKTAGKKQKAATGRQKVFGKN
jgi:hypothetical protein